MRQHDLLTPRSKDKPWVNAEIDAAFVQKVQGQARFIPLRYELCASELSPLLKSLHAPSIGLETYDDDLRRLVGTVYGITDEPPLGRAPDFTRPTAPLDAGLSLAAQQIAAQLIRRSKDGRARDPKLSVEELSSDTGLSHADFEVAVDELEEALCRA